MPLDSKDELQNQINMRSFLLKKYLRDGMLTIIIIVSIGVFRWLNFIDNNVAGTLLGTTVGYAMGGLRKLHE
jgi:hypothetical protein